MSISVASGGVTMTGDGFGGMTAYKQIAAAPSTAKKMQFAFRAYYTGMAGGNGATATSAAWNHTNYFGLGFSNTIHSFPLPFTAPYTDWLPDDFFGIISLGPTSSDSTAPLSGTPTFYADEIGWRAGYTAGSSGFTLNTNVVGMLSGSLQSRYQHYGFMDGIGAVELQAADQAAAANADYLINTCLPGDATSGAKFTGLWEVWASAIDKTMYGRLCWNGESLAGDDMFNAASNPYVGSGSKASLYEWTIHGDTTSNWRSSFDVVNFPRWLKMRFSHPTLVMKLDAFRVRYLDWNDNVLD